MKEVAVYCLPDKTITTDYMMAAKAWDVENKRRVSWLMTAGEMPSGTISIAPTTTTTNSRTI